MGKGRMEIHKGWSVLEKVATEVSLETLRSELTVESPRHGVLVDTPSEAEEPTVKEDPDELQIFQARAAQSAAALKLLIDDCSWTETIPESRGPGAHRILDMYDFVIDTSFPRSLRAWAVLPYWCCKNLERNRNIPCFLSHPTDSKIRTHSKLCSGEVHRPWKHSVGAGVPYSWPLGVCSDHVFGTDSGHHVFFREHQLSGQLD